MSILLLLICAKCCKPKKLSTSIPLNVSCSFKAFIRSVIVSYSVKRASFVQELFSQHTKLAILASKASASDNENFPEAKSY